MRLILFSFVALLLVSTACLPTQRESYIRSPDYDNIQRDKVLRTYPQTKNAQYQLRPNDVISIQVASSTDSQFNFLSYQNDQQMSNLRSNDPLLSGFDIGPDGTIFLPVIGKIEIAGLSIDEARDKIRGIIDDYLESPTVEIKLLNFQVSVLGEVEKEGSFVVYTPRLTILDALAQAGGITNFGNPELVKVVRNRVDTIEVAYVNVLEESVFASPYYYLQPNDIVTVGEFRGRNIQEHNIKYIQIALTAITAIGIFLNVFNN